MKTNSFIKLTALLALSLLCTTQSRAQLLPNSYFNIDWQLSMPLSNSFADDFSGWGMHFEGGYYLDENISIGGFIGYQTNFESFSRRTLDLGDGSALTTSQRHAIFQLPFGVAARYRCISNGVVQPYAGLKLGAEWAQLSSYYDVSKQYTDTWGFYLSPEVGISIFPRPDLGYGIHVALYYSYATNQGSLLTYQVDNLQNFGLRIGLSF